MTDHPVFGNDTPRRIHVSTELVLQPGALDAAGIINEWGSTTVRFTPADFGPYTGCTDVTFVAMAGNVADELRRLADRVHTPAAPSLRVVVDRAAETPELTEQQADAAVRFIRNVLAEYVWCEVCAGLVPNHKAQAHLVRTHSRGAVLYPARFYGEDDGDD